MAEQVKASGATTTAMPESGQPSTGSKPRSLFDAIDPNSVNTNKSNTTVGPKADKPKTTEMKTEGVKPLAALGPIVGILGLVIALVLWNTSHTAAIIVGLVGLAILILWFLARRAKKAAEASKGKKKPANQAAQNSHSRTRERRSPFGWRRRQRGPHTNPHGNNSPSGQSWWRRERRNPFNRDRSRDGSNSNSRRRNQRDRDNGGDRRRRWSPFGDRDKRKRDQSTGDGHTNSRNSDRRLWPFGGRKSHHRSDNTGGGKSPRSRKDSGSKNSNGSGHSGTGGSNSGRQWYKPWTWKGRNNGSGGNRSNSGTNGPGDSGSPSSEGNGNGRRRRRLRNAVRRLWSWQFYDPSEESVDGHYDPNRRNRFRDKWNGWRTQRQRQNVNYAGFNVDSDGNASPRYSRWWNWKDQARGRNWHTFGPKGPYRTTATRMDQTATPEPSSPALSGHSLSLGSGSGSGISTQSFTQSATAGSPVNNGGSTMASNGVSATHTVGGRVEAATYAAGAANSHRSAVWHIMVANQLRAWAARLANSDNPYHRASAQNYMHQAAQANAVAQNDARLAALQIGESNRAIGNGQQSVEG